MAGLVSMKTKIHHPPEGAVQDVCCAGFSSTRTIPHPHRTYNSAFELHLGHVAQVESLYGGKLRPCGRVLVGLGELNA